MFDICIFSGGGMNIFYTIGFCRYIEEQNNESIKNAKIFIGSSAGSILAILYSFGYSSNFIQQALELVNVKNISIDVNAIMKFLNTFGIIDADEMVKHVVHLLQKKTSCITEYTTFSQYYSITEKHLCITGTCVDTMCTKLFSKDTTPNMSIFLAMKISISIPFIMEPICYNNVRYVDGALYSNCYLEYVDYYFNDIDKLRKDKEEERKKNKKEEEKEEEEEEVKEKEEEEEEEEVKETEKKEEDTFVNLLAISLESDDILNIKKDSAPIPESFPLNINSSSEAIWQYGYKIIRGIMLHNQYLQMKLSKLQLNSKNLDWIKSSIFTIYVNHSISTEFNMSADNKRKLFTKGYDIAKEENTKST